MSPEEIRTGPAGSKRWTTPRVWRGGAVCLLLTVLMVVMQYRSGAYRADLAADSDEPAHAVSSLMVRDYLVQRFPHSPLAFAKTFYAHYPKVAIGHWPPLFYIGEALWMLVAGRSRVALLLFVALCGAALAGSIFLEVQRRCSTAAGLVSAAILIHPKIYQEMLVSVHPDLLLALLVFWAAVHCGNYMGRPSRRSRDLFWAFAITAFLVHGRAALLLFLPFCLLPLRPRKELWKWLAAAAALVVLLPLPALIGSARHFVAANAAGSAWLYLYSAASLTGWLGTALALAGLRLVLLKSPERTFWAAMAGLAVCGPVFYVLLPVHWDYRFLIPTLLALAVLAGGGVHVAFVLLARCGRLPRAAIGGAVAAGALAWMFWTAANAERKPDLGYREMIADCLLCGHEVSLVAADSVQEGDLIAEASLSDPDRAHTVLRASKRLAHSTWSGLGYRLLYATPAQLTDALDQQRVSLVVFEDGCSRADVVQLRSAVEQDPQNWELTSNPAQARGVTLFRRLLPGEAVGPRSGKGGGT